MDNHFGAAVKVLAINFAGAGDVAIVPDDGKVRTIVKISFTVAGATNITFKTGGTSRSGPYPFTANMSLVYDYDQVGWFSAAAGENFIINSSAAVQVSGTVWYVSGK